MHSVCVHMLAANTVHNTHTHIAQLNDMHIFMQAACNDTDMDTHAETHASLVLPDMRDVATLHAHTRLSRSYTQYNELHYINSVYNTVSLYMSACRQMQMRFPFSVLTF